MCDCRESVLGRAGLVPQGPSRFERPQPSAAARHMVPRGHPWLLWPGATRDERIILNNRLAEIHMRAINRPKIIDADVFAALDIDDDFGMMFTTRLRVGNGEYDINPWTRAFTVREDIYPEWVMEFYSSLVITNQISVENIDTDEVIFFRLGGIQRRYTFPEWGRLTGMFTRAEARDVRLM